jgi:hypothetical protein
MKLLSKAFTQHAAAAIGSAAIMTGGTLYVSGLESDASYLNRTDNTTQTVVSAKQDALQEFQAGKKMARDIGGPLALAGVPLLGWGMGRRNAGPSGMV